MDRFLTALQGLTGNPALWLFLTLVFFILGTKVFELARRNLILSPIVIAIASLIILLKVTGVSYETYFEGAGLIHFLLGPAAVALAVPLFEQRRKLATLWLPLAVGLTAGCAAAVTSVVLVGGALGLSHETLMSMVPKSVTTPIAMGISEAIGGMPDLTACLVVVTGIFGSIVGRPLFTRLRITDEPVRGAALGLAAHGMGTSTAFMIGNRAGAFAGLAMGISGIITSILAPLLAPPLVAFFGW